MTLTGHAHHFLSRLDRLSVPHLDIALSLYRDDGLLRHILDTARVPEGMERVAVSLADPENGPFLVVTRDGKFVTCLGEGMSAKNLHVVTRERLDAITSRVAMWRERSERALSVQGNAGEFMRALYERGPWLPREQFQAIAALQPFLAIHLLRWLIEEFQEVQNMRQRLLREMPKSGKLHRRFDELLHLFWCRSWTIGHLSVLAAMDGKTPFEHLPEVARAPVATINYSWFSVSQMLVGNALRGIWGAARIGKDLLSVYKRECEAAVTLHELIDAAFTLTVMGCRHARLRAEIKKALSPNGLSPTTPDFVVAVRELMLQVLDTEDTHGPTGALHQHGRAGAELAVAFSKRLPPTSAYHFKEIEEVPPEIAYRTLLLDATDFVNHREVFPTMTLALQWLSHATPDDLYLPADYIAAIRTPYDPRQVLALLRDDRSTQKAILTEAAKTRQAGPTRSAPCPCGSGKKYKRCCSERER
ncbi:YecA family protein [Polyangium sorediatum]|uniref:SEC-C domain-containing protein n=1 Tax=Polyangium sorediatum TaxID=889274 RepID=A0ABT6NN61_9BACT|nr:SEC-C domain-containing protein [Polyangium sorediatum]MDI1429761.1 SEC-C domain-containing protein [Polyangium sorediatum]